MKFKANADWGLFWVISETQIQSVKRFYENHMDNPFVRSRVIKNIKKQGLNLTNEAQWRALVNCLLTTQQKSGPESSIAQFLRLNPFPLSLSYCLENRSYLDFQTEEILSDFGGIRRAKTIGSQLKTNLENLIGSNWQLFREIAGLDFNLTVQSTERALAQSTQSLMTGLGPKQSRNFLQILGVTKYEIPIDSRIIRWLNQYKFPIKVTSLGLSDVNYYEFILDGICELCDKAEIYPCALDAAIFSSFDQGQWTEDNIVF